MGNTTIGQISQNSERIPTKEELKVIPQGILNAYNREWWRRYREIHKEQIKATNREYYKRLSKDKLRNVQTKDKVKTSLKDIKTIHKTSLNILPKQDIFNNKEVTC